VKNGEKRFLNSRCEVLVYLYRLLQQLAVNVSYNAGEFTDTVIFLIHIARARAVGYNNAIKLQANLAYIEYIYVDKIVFHISLIATKTCTC
jgi:hypothetical protein